MKIFGISNTRRFFEKIQSCTGEVYSVGANGKTQDLKAMAGYLLQSDLVGAMGRIKEIDLRLEKPSDVQIMIDYVAQMD